MTALCIATGYNSPPRNPRDASAVFLPESAAFCFAHSQDGLPAPRYVIEDRIPAPRRRTRVETVIRATPGLDVLAVFGHGHRSGLACTGHSPGTDLSGS